MRCIFMQPHTKQICAIKYRSHQQRTSGICHEYGICDASGNGAIDKKEADRWVQTMDEYGVSYIAWNLSNKQESSSIIKSSCSKVSGFKKSDLSDEGKWLYSMLRKKAGLTK